MPREDARGARPSPRIRRWLRADHHVPLLLLGPVELGCGRAQGQRRLGQRRGGHGNPDWRLVQCVRGGQSRVLPQERAARDGQGLRHRRLQVRHGRVDGFARRLLCPGWASRRTRLQHPDDFVDEQPRGQQKLRGHEPVYHGGHGAEEDRDVAACRLPCLGRRHAGGGGERAWVADVEPLDVADHVERHVPGRPRRGGQLHRVGGRHLLGHGGEVRELPEVLPELQERLPVRALGVHEQRPLHTRALGTADDEGHPGGLQRPDRSAEPHRGRAGGRHERGHLRQQQGHSHADLVPGGRGVGAAVALRAARRRGSLRREVSGARSRAEEEGREAAEGEAARAGSAGH
mmetsp:Transcript_20029/g.58161  ORF Transcript_20029/g.58161 Transcript_20029/m.58161 type:complete len:346 (+) Transcript_20029:957-1994(+)